MPNGNENKVIQQIPIDQIKPSPYQARKNFDEAKLQYLAQTMKDNGLEQPVILRSQGDGSYELIAGERRLRAAKLLNWPTIEAIVRPVANEQDAAIRGLIENVQREDLNPLEKAHGYKRLVDMGLTQDQIAQKVGVTDRTIIYRHLALLDLPPEIQAMLPRGNITETHTRSIRKLPDKEQQIKVAQQAEKEGWSVKETEKRVNQLLGKLARHLGSPSSSPSAKGADPLASCWDKVGSGGELVWSVKYVAANTWQFRVQARMDDLKDNQESLADWFAEMAQTIKDRLANTEGRARDDGQEESEPSEVVPPPTSGGVTQEPTIMQAPPSQEKPLDPKIAAMIARRKAQRMLP